MPDNWVEIAKLIRKVEVDRPILCIIEDIDLVIEKFGEEVFLNFLDGLNSITNVVYVATTNNIEKIPDRIKDRPSRFDKKYEIKKPDDSDRELYFKTKLLPEDLKKYNITKLVKDTKNFTMAHLKEAFISLYILGNDYSEVISRLKKSKITEPSRIGFDLDDNY
jgi:SpoVK/Ycf46/Vps4 family AAA+-type ATPase